MYFRSTHHDRGLSCCTRSDVRRVNFIPLDFLFFLASHNLSTPTTLSCCLNQETYRSKTHDRRIARFCLCEMNKLAASSTPAFHDLGTASGRQAGCMATLFRSLNSVSQTPEYPNPLPGPLYRPSISTFVLFVLAYSVTLLHGSTRVSPSKPGERCKSRMRQDLH